MRDPKPVVKVDKITREIVARYPSTCAAEQAEGVPKTSIWAACNKKALTRGRYYYRYAEEFDPCEVFHTKHGCPLALLDAKTGKYKLFASRKEISGFLLIGEHYIGVAIAGKKKLLGRYYVCYAPKRLNLRKERKER
jgi:hypothetical protein